MEELDEVQMPHRPVQYHPGLVPNRPGVWLADVPTAHLRPLTGRARHLRSTFWIALSMLTAVTMALATLLAFE